MGVEIALAAADDFGAARGQPNEVETEAGSRGSLSASSPLAKQPIDHRPLGHGLPVSTDSTRTAAISAEEDRLQPPAAPLPCFSIAATSVTASRDKVADHGFGRDRSAKRARRCNPAAVCAG